MEREIKFRKIIKNTLKKFLNENLQQNYSDIQISKIEPDERSNRREKIKYYVNYQTSIDGKLIEIEGLLIPYHTGRSEEYEFEPSYFTDEESEHFYDMNWETIEYDILNKFWEGNF